MSFSQDGFCSDLQDGALTLSLPPTPRRGQAVFSDQTQNTEAGKLKPRRAGVAGQGGERASVRRGQRIFSRGGAVKSVLGPKRLGPGRRAPSSHSGLGLGLAATRLSAAAPPRPPPRQAPPSPRLGSGPTLAGRRRGRLGRPRLARCCCGCCGGGCGREVRALPGGGSLQRSRSRRRRRRKASPAASLPRPWGADGDSLPTSASSPTDR